MKTHDHVSTKRYIIWSVNNKLYIEKFINITREAKEGLNSFSAISKLYGSTNLCFNMLLIITK